MVSDAVELAGIVVPLGDHASPAIREALVAGEYEEGELSALRAVLHPDDVVMEVGTGLGLLSAWCARVVGSERVFTFEANPALEQPIRRLYELNRVSPRLEICAVSHSEGSVVLRQEADIWASSTVRGKGGIVVPARSFEQLRIAIKPTLLIVDIEGGELELVRHARFDDIDRVVIELHPDVIGEDGCESVVTALGEASFKVTPELSSSDAVLAFTRAADPKVTTEVLVREALAELPWQRAERALTTLLEAIPPGASFVLLDDALWWRGGEFGDRDRRFLVERDREDWGAPEDAAAAVAELDARRAEGVRWLTVAWPAFWWLEDFPALARELSGFPEIVRTRDVRIWKLG
jgi:FkbM family methyltransferase